jgi:succinyl-CoA synthetase beta subunit
MTDQTHYQAEETDFSLLELNPLNIQNAYGTVMMTDDD